MSQPPFPDVSSYEWVPAKKVNPPTEEQGSSSATPYGTLIKFPKEIRSMIYSYAIAAGTTALRRTSKHLCADTEEALIAHGGCYIKIKCQCQKGGKLYKSYYSYRHHPQFLERGTSNVNIELTISRPMSKPGDDSDIRMLQSVLIALLNCMKAHKSCHIKIGFVWQKDLGCLDFDELKVLRKFKNVTVEFCMDLQTDHPIYVAFKPSEAPGHAIAASAEVESVLGSKDGSTKSPELTILRTVESGMSNPSLPRGGRKELAMILGTKAIQVRGLGWI